MKMVWMQVTIHLQVAVLFSITSFMFCFSVTLTHPVKHTCTPASAVLFSITSFMVHFCVTLTHPVKHIHTSQCCLVLNHQNMHHAQYRFQTFTRIWYFTSISGISKVDCKVDLLTGLLQPLFQEQVDCKVDLLTGLLQPLFQEQSWSAHWPTSTSVSGTSWSAHWAYFNLCFRNKVDLLTGPTSTSVSGTKLICSLGLLYIQNIQERWDSSAGRPSDWKARCNTDVQVRVPGVARDFSPTASFQCRLSHGVCTAPVCNRMHQHLCAR